MEDWKEYKLDEITLNITDGTHSTVVDDINGKFLLLSCKNIKNGLISISSSERKINQETFYQLRKRTKLEKNDVLVTTVGTIGEMAIITDDFPLYEFQRSVGILKPNQSKVFPKFLYYSLKNELPQIMNKTTGAVQQCLFLGDIKEIVINLPPLATQQKIAAILSSLDDKIELNNKINANLEQQAQALFKSWFVDFEPFGGEMPAGWKVGTLSDVAKLSAGGDKPKETSDKKNEVYNIPIYSNGLDNFGLYGFTNKATIFEESVTVSARGTIGFVCLRTMPYVPIVRLVSVIPKCTNVSAKYLYLSLRNKNIAGTGTTQQQLTVPAFSKENILIPPEEVMTSFTNLVQPMFSKIFELRTENEKLATIRDILLPKLMAGELKVD